MLSVEMGQGSVRFGRPLDAADQIVALTSCNRRMYSYYSQRYPVSTKLYSLRSSSSGRLRNVTAGCGFGILDFFRTITKRIRHQHEGSCGHLPEGPSFRLVRTQSCTACAVACSGCLRSGSADCSPGILDPLRTFAKGRAARARAFGRRRSGRRRCDGVANTADPGCSCQETLLMHSSSHTACRTPSDPDDLCVGFDQGINVYNAGEDKTLETETRNPRGIVSCG